MTDIHHQIATGHDIRTKMNNKEINFYSFATKYCNWHNKASYAIYDSFVDKVLMAYKRNDKFSTFTHPEFVGEQSPFSETVVEKAVSNETVDTTHKILELIKMDPRITITEMATRVGISTRAVDKHIAKLKRKLEGITVENGTP